ncbi:hypothetical protein HUG12_09830 [Halorarum salinum]|uniref:Uncharacterized protein n=2 Tax=Halorarum salinum TaxID=2743089 RepID=A0A7D5QK93_9EURY|nr:hypothetical protein HUG12_09830 [Halobaculum salinum]
MELGTATYRDSRLLVPAAVFDAEIFVRGGVVQFGTHPAYDGIVLTAAGYPLIASGDAHWIGSSSINEDVLALPQNYFRVGDGDPFTLTDGMELVFVQPEALVGRRQCVLYPAEDSG